MCGIIGYLGNREASSIILRGLKKLEYRGYDSAGILTMNPEIQLQKDVGKLAEINFETNGLPGKIGIGHTRWATHGGVTKTNAHPHLSNNKKIAVIHNGIIENYQELQKFLKSKNFVFHTQTDTEVIPNLIEYFMRNEDLFESVKRTIRMLEGSYALVIINEGKHEMIAVRKESPLVVGVGEEELFVASDVPAFLDYTKRVIYLHENDLVVLNEDVKVFNLKEDSFVKRPVDVVDWDIEHVKKGNFDHFMIKEITEQADTIKKAVMQDKKTIMKIAKEIKNAENVYFVACGTSSYACMSAIYKFATIAKKKASVVLGSEFHNFKDFIDSNTVVIAVSQSGETADTLGAVRVAKERGAKIISIVNVMGSSLTRESDEAIMMQSGPEICVLSTKTYTAQLAILTLLAYALAGRYEEGQKKLKGMINYIYYLTSANARKSVKTLAHQLKDAKDIYLIGRGLQYPTSLEAALKIKEVSYIHAEGFAGGELKHGTIALIEKGTPCIVFTSDKTEKEILSNAAELKARGGFIIGIGGKNNELFDFFIKVREAEEANSICQIIPIQILAYQLALLRGLDPDKPRNLAKSVTVK